MKTDANKNIGSITYNHLNLPTSVGVDWNSITYVYDATGVKLSKTVHSYPSTTTTQYAGNYIYENNTLQFFNQPEGYIQHKSGIFSYVYQYKDHLGNVRLSYADVSTTNTPVLEIIEESNYYPFGLKHKGYNNAISSNGNSTAQKWSFEGVELEESLGYNSYEMDFRHYDPAIGRFMAIDPMAEERNWLTPYNFVQNNPILRVDPTGLLDDYGLDTETGELVFIKETDANTDTIYTGEVTGTNDDGSSSFKKDGKSSKTFKKGSSNIKEMTTTTNENGETVGTGQGASVEGLVFSEGNMQIGLEVMEFISFESNIELSAWGFETDKGQGLYISPWDGNTSDYSKDDTDNDSNYVQRKEDTSFGRGNKRYGKKIGHIHTHPVGSNTPSNADIRHRDSGKNPKYKHFINSRYDGWREYSK